MTIQVDRYTKAVLTVMAIALVVIALNSTGLIFFKYDRVNDRVTLCENKLETVGCTKEVRFNDGYVPSINQSGID